MTQRTDTHAPITTEPAPGLRFQIATELFEALPEMAADVRTKPPNGTHCLDFRRQLLLGQTPEEAATFMAFALAPRHGVWWGHECLQASPDLLSAQDRDMLALVAAWVGEPDEDHRYAALDTGFAADPRGPGAWLAMATGWSGGSMSPRALPEVPVPGFLMGRALNAAVMTALARVPQEKRRRMLDHYISIAEVLAKSG